MFFCTLNCALLFNTLRYFTRLLRKQGPTLCKTELAETTHPKHRGEKNPASADFIKARDNLRHDEMKGELSLISPFLEFQGKAKFIPASQPLKHVLIVKCMPDNEEQNCCHESCHDRDQTLKSLHFFIKT